MLTSSNQYLRPDYLTPLPTTLDAKKSPLALLAQTCSAIGADSPNPKLLSAAEKASKAKFEARDKSPAVHSPVDAKPSFKPYESCLTREKTRTPEDRSSTSAKTPVSSKGSAATTPVQARCASNQSSSSHRTSPPGSRKTPADRDERASPRRDSPALHKPTQDAKSFAPASLVDAKDSLAFKPSLPTASAAFLGGLPPAGFPLPMDLMAGSLMAAQHHALKNGLNPYLAYARMKGAASGAGELAACRDPYCTGCSLSSHLLKAACPGGCAQCEHGKALLPAPYAHAHAQLAALAAAAQLPFVCSWVGGDAPYCGKRFGSSEELLQHLRSHTAPAEAGGLLRGFPTPPLSPLPARYHPYGKPGLFLPPHPSLAAYFPAYPLFGPRPLHP